MQIIVTSYDGKQEGIDEDTPLVSALTDIPRFIGKGKAVLVMPSDMDQKLKVEMTYRIAKAMADNNRIKENERTD